jgi:hypothetical protein
MNFVIFDRCVTLVNRLLIIYNHADRGAISIYCSLAAPQMKYWHLDERMAKAS